MPPEQLPLTLLMCRIYKWATLFSCKLNFWLFHTNYMMNNIDSTGRLPAFPVIMQASSFPRTRSFRDMRSTTSYLIVVGNNASSRASLHPDYQLPKDLWWAHSPGCPPPIKGRRSARPIEENQSLGSRKDSSFFATFIQINQVLLLIKIKILSQ